MTPSVHGAVRVRFGIYGLVACVASALQFALFDCNGARPLSFVAGALAIWVALVALDRICVVGTSARSVRARIALGMTIAVVGVGVVWSLAWLTMISHMCG